jgi:hypothetical protein
MSRGYPVVFLIALCLPGCSRHDGIDRVPITGLITVQGAPLDFASVQFTPLGSETMPGALGVSDANGRFDVISSRRDDPGIPPGEYLVTVNRWANPDGKALGPNATQADNPLAAETIPAPYSGPASPLRAMISKEGGEVKLDIPVKLLNQKKPKS